MKAASSGTRVEGRKLLLICVLIGFCSCPSIKGGSLEALQTAERMSTLMSEFGQIDCSIFNSNNCPRLYQPVCGSDGKTYDNLCVFCNTILSNGSLVLRYLGECY
ncbi:ovomucoid-like isoform X9 [Hemicordylus capensis]|uniref:ovomucoid-like isoform X9 n=1 Tax=Hemicordylus capensis TaxID=884348 RepID=UPI002304A6FF|nr:ovomucoid-like isoform X9 [Hemicordylus capensis]